MPGNQKNNKSFFNNKRRARAMRTAIMRDPEVPMTEFSAAEFNSRGHFANEPSTSQQSSLNDQENLPSAFNYHEPRLNIANEMRHKLAEIKQYEQKTLESLQDLTIGTKAVVNKEITSKLNFPANQAIFKDLISLDDAPKSPEKVRKAHNLIQKSNKKIASPSTTDKATLKNEIHKLINELVELEYKDAYEDIQDPKAINLPTEAGILGFTRFSTHRFHLPKKDAITANYIQQVRSEVDVLFNSEEYLDGPKWRLLEAPKPSKTTNTTCKCLEDFYTHDSNCV